MSEVGMCEVKAAPADEARAVHHSRRREALPPAGFAGDRGFHAKAWSLRARESRAYLPKLAGANS